MHKHSQACLNVLPPIPTCFLSPPLLFSPLLRPSSPPLFSAFHQPDGASSIGSSVSTALTSLYCFRWPSPRGRCLRGFRLRPAAPVPDPITVRRSRTRAHESLHTGGCEAVRGGPDLARGSGQRVWASVVRTCSHARSPRSSRRTASTHNTDRAMQRNSTAAPRRALLTTLKKPRSVQSC